MSKKNPLRVEIIAVGSELLTPDFQDTNSLYLTERLNALGIEVCGKTIVGDRPDHLSLRLRQALRQADVVIVMGGLGPTGDDKTREAVAAALGKKLVFKKELIERIEERFRRRHVLMPKANRKQAFVIQGAEVLPNIIGSAPGEWLDLGAKKIVLLPGPASELKLMCEECVWPRLSKVRQGHLARRVLKTTGLTESQVEAQISGLYPRGQDLGVTVLASPGQIEVRLSAYSTESLGEAERKLRRLTAQMIKRLKSYVFSAAGESLEEVAGRMLKKNRKTLAVAESCSGGLLSHRLTNIPGSSSYFLAGAVAYSNVSKVDLLGVPSDLLEAHGAVSFPAARAMAEGIRRRAGADYGLAVTGIAGPGGGTAEKPAGLVYTALAWPGGSEVRRNLFLGPREQVKAQSAQKALDMLRRHLLLRPGGRKKKAK
ncbi:MAG: competence/damage-inducible protein A [Acidobacteriota bacterium]